MNITKQQQKYLETFVDTYPDFPGPGVNFKDLSLLYTDPIAVQLIQEYFEAALKPLNPDCVIGCDARGFIIGTLIAQKLRLPFVLARKPGKLPGDLLKQEYDLEYGKAELQMHKHIISQYKAPVIADDVLATAGTMGAVIKMLAKINISVNSIATVSEIVGLNGRGRLLNEFGFNPNNVFSVLKH